MSKIIKPIDANALVKELLSITCISCDGGYYKGRFDERVDILERIKNAPVLAVTPVVRGKWVLDENNNVVCTECGNQTVYHHEVWHFSKTPFCSGCGADMRAQNE